MFNRFGMDCKIALQFAEKECEALDAEVLLCFACGITKEQLFAHQEKLLNNDEWKTFQEYVERRKGGEPVAYITNHKEFFGLDFYVDRRVLIPRPETEQMVELALKEIGACDVMVDVGTGSGCILIAVVKNCKQKILDVKFFATDISSDALEVAKLNTRKHGVEHSITFLQGDLLDPLLDAALVIKNSKLLITANLPYVSEAIYERAPSIKREPKQALVAGDGGLALYKELFVQLAELKKQYQCDIVLFCEINPDQDVRIKEMALTVFPGARCIVHADLSGRDRIFEARF